MEPDTPIEITNRNFHIGSLIDLMRPDMPTDLMGRPISTGDQATSPKSMPPTDKLPIIQPISHNLAMPIMPVLTPMRVTRLPPMGVTRLPQHMATPQLTTNIAVTD